jgi:ceramide synthetase
MTKPMEFFYVVELGCYIHQLMWTEVHRSDAVEMIIHHFATIGLIAGSYVSNFTRVGLTIIFIHDVADIFLESAKVVNYINLANKQMTWLHTLSTVQFVIFAITFVITRLFIYPFYVLNSVFFEGREVFGGWQGYYFFSVLLSVLQCLHIFWFYLIARMAYRLVTTGTDKDERSDDEEEDDDEDPNSNSLKED